MTEPYAPKTDAKNGSGDGSQTGGRMRRDGLRAEQSIVWNRRAAFLDSSVRSLASMLKPRRRNDKLPEAVTRKVQGRLPASLPPCG